MNKPVLITGFICLFIGWAIGNHTTQMTQLCPGDKPNDCLSCTIEDTEPNNAEIAQYFSEKVSVPTCEPEIQYVALDYMTCSECDCEQDFLAGRDTGYAECTRDNKMFMNK